MYGLIYFQGMVRVLTEAGEGGPCGGRPWGYWESVWGRLEEAEGPLVGVRAQAALSAPRDFLVFMLSWRTCMGGLLISHPHVFWPGDPSISSLITFRLHLLILLGPLGRGSGEHVFFSSLSFPLFRALMFSLFRHLVFACSLFCLFSQTMVERVIQKPERVFHWFWEGVWFS